MLENIIVLSSLPLLSYLTKKIYWHLTIIVIILLALKRILSFDVNSLVLTSSFTLNDLISSSLITLSFWITALIFIARYKTFNNNTAPKIFSLICIILLLSLVGSFSASSILIFYIIFEASLIPTIVLIITWGYQPERIQARIYLIIYTITASLPLLIIILIVYSKSKHLNISIPDQLLEIKNSHLTWIMLIIGFLVKLPLFSVHLWLPKAHVEAPVAGSIILAAILLKLGGYGLARIVIMFNYINKLLVAPIVSIAIIGGVVTSIICLRQTDIKSLIAYSSVGHMGLIVAGILSNSKLGIQARLAIIIAHGLRSSAIFCMANINYRITSTRRILLTKGIISIIPNISIWWFMFSCANIAAPPRINLIREIILIIAIIKQSIIVVIPLRLISFITVAYSLYLYSSTNHGSNINISMPISNIKISDINLITLHLIPIVIIILKPEIIISWC
jgi:NADH-ubiquinone oxidoreductase chain 4